MKRAVRVVAALAALALLYLLAWPVPIDPVAWQPGPNPGLTGPFAANDALASLQLVEVGAGPEDVTEGPDGLLYTGLEDGRIVRFFAGGQSVVSTYADTGGRPLGMEFAPDGELIVADARRGLLSVTPDGAVRVLADAVDGRRMLFVDDLDVAVDGTVWFSDASQRFGQQEFMLDLIEARPTGRLLRYEPRTGQLEVVLEGLGFANGVALGPEEAYVLVNETLYARITRLWLKGPRAGQQETFVENLPGHPDNVSFDGDRVFWVALPGARVPALEWLAPYPFLRRVLVRLPGATRIPGRPIGWVIALDTDGNVVGNLQDRSGRYATVTSVNEIGGDLYLGSIAMNAVGRLAADR